MKKARQPWYRRFCRNSSSQTVCYCYRAYYGLCVLIKDIGRRIPLQLQCSYQGQQGDVSQSVHGNYKTGFWGGQNLTAVEGNISVYQVNPVSRITGEMRAEFWRTWGRGFDKKRAWLEAGGGTFQYVRGNYKSSEKGDKPDDWSNKTSLYIIWLVMFSILERLMLDAACNLVFKGSKYCVKSSQLVVVWYIDRKLEYFIEYLWVPLFSDIANYKKEIRIIVKYNGRGDVVMHCHHQCIFHSWRNAFLHQSIHKIKSGVSLQCARFILVHTTHYLRLEKPAILLATHKRLPRIL